MQDKREKVRILRVKYPLTFAWLIYKLAKQSVSVSNTELSNRDKLKSGAGWICLKYTEKVKNKVEQNETAF